MTRLVVSVLGLMCLMLPMAMLADDRRGGSEEVSEMAFAILEKAGVGTDSDSLVTAVRSSRDPMVRWISIEILGQRKATTAQGTLLKALKGDPDRLVRETAALALARMGQKVGVSALKEFMAAPTDSARQIFTAARLAELGDASGYQYVCMAAKSESSSQRESAVPALVPFLLLSGLTSDCAASPSDLLLSLVEDRSADVRYTALLHLPMAVGKGLGLERARLIVNQLAQSDPEPKVREEADFVLKTWRLQEESRKPDLGERR
jgi:HEAT repeat protein